ncbi:MAG TPA: ribosomal protein S18-alanine N-acetyltransferase [Anaeromyxobacteraceae bacterium]|nr:ribosomal protein S18-alanine N-acetyltransferase [Anaeromyxobacteraceae bacterium]
MSAHAPSLRLRPAAESDLPRLTGLERAAHSHPWTEDQLRSELGRAYATVLCAEAIPGSGEETSGRIDGFIVYWVIHDELHVLDVVAAPEARRRGVGRALMEAALADGVLRGAARAMLEVRRSNAPALALYRSLGFLHDTVRRGYYQDGEDAVLMSLSLHGRG